MVFNCEINQLELMQARIKSVPHGWHFTYVGRAFCIQNNLRKPISEEERKANPGNYPYYGPTKIQGYIGTYEQDGNYALIGEDGDHFLKFETHSMTQLVDGKCTVNNHAHVIKGTKDASREWFYYYFMHRDIFSFLSRQGAGRYKLNKASLEKMPLLLPPIAEQKKIVQILSTWDKAISATEKLLTNSQQQKKALMQQLLTGKKRLLDGNGMKFSEEWKKVELGDVFEKVSNGLTYDANSLDGLPVTRIETISTGRVNFEKVGWAPDCDNTRRFKLNPGDILYSHINSLEHIGRVAYFNDGNPLYHGMNLLLLRAKKQNNSLFLFHLLNSQVGKKYAKTYAKSAVNQASISTTDIKTFKVFIPEILEQQKIATVLSAADAEIATLEKKLTCLKDEKKALMQQLLTGKHRVKVDAEEAVSA
ncbi:TPA: restriction endonuclease subunit S [Kluyvera cryocrescens]